MTYGEFQQTILEKVKGQIHLDLDVSICTSMKNNDQKKTGLTFQKEGEKTAPVIYLEKLYEDFIRGGININQAVSNILEAYFFCDYSVEKEAEMAENFDACKDKLAFRLINSEMNKEVLKDIPYIKFHDLSIVFYLVLESGAESMATIQITHSLMNHWGIDVETLYRQALKNSQRILPAEFQTLSGILMKNIESDSLLSEALGEEINQIEKAKGIMYVLSNSARQFGAGCILYPHVLEIIGGLLKEDYYILPSSCHELIIIPKSKALETSEMDEMVQEINETQVVPEEVLSNHVYFYSREAKLITY